MERTAYSKTRPPARSSTPSILRLAGWGCTGSPTGSCQEGGEAAGWLMPADAEP